MYRNRDAYITDFISTVSDGTPSPFRRPDDAQRVAAVLAAADDGDGDDVDTRQPPLSTLRSPETRTSGASVIRLIFSFVTYKPQNKLERLSKATLSSLVGKARSLP